MIRTLPLAALLLVLSASPARSLEKPAETPAAQGAKTPADKGPAQSIIGGWVGGPCQGEWLYRADGTFRARDYTPGNNRLAGTWEIKAGAAGGGSPVLVRTCKSSDDADLVGKTWEVKLLDINEKALSSEEAKGYAPFAFARLSAAELAQFEAGEAARDTEIAAFQGTWVPLEYEEAGKKGDASPTRHIIKGDRLTIQVDGKTIDTGRLAFDPLQNPKALYLYLHSGTTHALIYTRAGNHIIYCGNRKQEPLPKEFATGTPNGGEYLMAWRIEKEK